jgi:cytochrome c
MKERTMRATHVFSVVVMGAAIAVAACSGAGDMGATGSRVIRGASPEAGKTLIVRYGCGACHQVPGIKQANGLVAPPLSQYGRRGTIAGHFATTPDNLINWINNPQAMVPGTDMPNLGVTKDEARNIAAYLESLQ